MNGMDAKDRTEELVFDYALDAAPDKVWRAVHLPAFRRAWLPDGALLDSRPVSSVPGREICYRMRDDAPPFFESMVTFQIKPGPEGGTVFRIIHRLTDARLRLDPGKAANSNRSCLMRAA